jgi:hypothetical protein
MARAIIRYSFNSTGGNKYKAERARRKIRDVLEPRGFKRVGSKASGTASWELRKASTATIGAALAEVFEIVEKLDAGVLDHVWTYCDE